MAGCLPYSTRETTTIDIIFGAVSFVVPMGVS